jgi:exopolysaccharide production protein ExoZ
MNHPAGAPPASPAQLAGHAPLIGIQYLRAIGAMMIVYFHNVIQIPAYTPYLNRYFWGLANLTNGVDLFFVVSGFIMLVTGRRATSGDFLARRAIRIAPLYWVLTLLLAAIVAVRPELFRSTVLTPVYLVKSLLFIPYKINGYFFPLLVPGWSLNFEMFFYLAFALGLFAPHRWRTAIMGLSFLIVYFGGNWIRHGMDPITRSESVLTFYTSLHLFEFWAGMLIADLHLRGWLKISPIIGWIVAIVSLMWLLSGLPLDLVSGSEADAWLNAILPSATLLLAVVSLENTASLPKSPRLVLLGDASYSLYLTHIFTLGVARLIWERLGLQRESIAFVGAYAVLAMTLSVLAAVATYRWVEIPMYTRMLAWYRQWKSARVERLQTT